MTNRSATNDPLQQDFPHPTEPTIVSAAAPLPTPPPVDTPAQVASLLQTLEDAAAEDGLLSEAKPQSPHESKLVEARLGIASGLFTALRCKHRSTADHCLRVALGCSSWASFLKMSEEDLTAIEIAALLHDVGKIGVPDNILLKPGRLAPEEMEVMVKHRQMSLAILQACGVPTKILDIVRYSSALYDGGGDSEQRKGDQLPIESRMLSIVDAFDSMTIDHVFRPARSRERALAELLECAGKQFDPNMVRAFSEMFTQDQNMLTANVAKRWLCELSQTESPMPWQLSQHVPIADVNGDDPLQLFEEKLIDNMHDGVIFVDAQSKIFLWSTGSERLTGVSANAANGRVLVPSLLDMCQEDGSLIDDDHCSVIQAIQTGVQSMQRVGIIGRNGERVDVDMHVIPVCNREDTVLGVTVLLHDASSETSLEEKCQALHVQVAKDPMTQVANRAEFDRMQELFIDAHQDTGLPCSLIMTDIDHFKQVNDNYGHQAGDEAIIAIASLLKSMCRAGDLVARYGGEEFAVLCADCNNATAAQRAEGIRRELSEKSFSFLANNNITASFGVTELQPGDTPETMLRRADRALLQAKDQGRNQVVQLGDGMNEEPKKTSWWAFKPWRGKALLNVKLVTLVPSEVAVQKLRGFISDHSAKILKTDENYIRLEINDWGHDGHQRRSDRNQVFTVEINFSENHIEKTNSQGLAAGSYAQTNLEVSISPRRDRDRRREATTDRARMLLGSLKSYLMAKEADASAERTLEAVEATTD